MKLYYADFSSMDLEELIKEYTEKVDMHRQSKITRTQALAARVRSLLAGYLLQCAVKAKTGTDVNKEVLELSYSYGSNGKPYLKDYPQIYFSLSHSGTVVACAVAEQEIGLDVQEHVNVKRRLAERFFTKEENELLKAQPNEKAYQELFFRLWSVKESYIKYTGLGMGQGLNSFEIHWEEKVIRTDTGSVACFDEVILEKLPEYAISVCMKEREQISVIKKELII